MSGGRRFYLDGWYDQGNMGDAAFLEAWNSIVAASGLRVDCARKRRAGRGGRLGKALDLLRTAGFALRGYHYVRLGGDLIHERGERVILTIFLKVLLFRLLGRRCVFLSVGIDPHRVRRTAALLRWICAGSEFAVRDRRSFDYFSRYPTRALELMPDMAVIPFSAVTGTGCGERTGYLNPYVPPLADRSRRERFAATLLALYHGERLVGFSTADLALGPSLDAPSSLLIRSTEDLRRLADTASYVISVRLHLLIFCLVQGIPVLALDYHGKVGAFLSTWCENSEEVVLDPWSADPEVERAPRRGICAEQMRDVGRVRRDYVRFVFGTETPPS